MYKDSQCNGFMLRKLSRYQFVLQIHELTYNQRKEKISLYKALEIQRRHEIEQFLISLSLNESISQEPLKQIHFSPSWFKWIHSEMTHPFSAYV